jgi:hypothetical protein
MEQGSNHGGSRIFSLLYTRPDQPWVQLSLLYKEEEVLRWE